MATVTKSKLMEKLGQTFVKAHNEAKGQETNYGRIQVPGGIENGVARLVDVKIDEYKEGDNKGKLFFRAAGVIVEPQFVTDKDGRKVKVAGLQTSIMEPLCDTPTRAKKTAGEHIAVMYNELRKLGVDTASLEPNQIEAVMIDLKAAAPHFRFRTWQGKPQTTGPYAGQEPRVNEDWQGFIEEYDAEAAEDAGPAAVEDESGEAESGAADEPEAEAAADESADDTPVTDADLDGLANEAEVGVTAAQSALEAYALAQGLTQNDVDHVATTWTALVTMIRAKAAAPKGKKGKAPPATPAEVAEFLPKKGDVYLHAVPADPKNPKKGKKDVECEVVHIDGKNKTVNLKNLDDGTTLYTGVAYTALKELS